MTGSLKMTQKSTRWPSRSTTSTPKATKRDAAFGCCHIAPVPEPLERGCQCGSRAVKRSLAAASTSADGQVPQIGKEWWKRVSITFMP